MPARLIINADDFGLTCGINRSVEELHRVGVLSSATLMANGPAFDDAVEIAKRNPQLGVGCHVVLVDGVPISPPESVSSLIGPDGRSFRSSLPAFAAAALLERIHAEDIFTEALAQVAKLQNAKISVTHLDTRKHAHFFPAVSSALLQAARATSVGAIRNPFEQRWSAAAGRAGQLRRLELRGLNLFRRRCLRSQRLRDGSIATADGTIGISATGNLNEATLRGMLDRMPEGTWELVCHPGYDDADLAGIATRLRAHREVERCALLKVVPTFLGRSNAPSLIHYGDLRK